MSDTKVIRKDYSSKELIHVFGGSNVLVHYFLETLDDGYIVNKYVVTCKITHIEVGSPLLAVVRVQAWTNNQDTLTAEAVADLCGWDWDVICETEMPGLSPAEADKYMGSIPKTQTASFS